MIGCIIQARIGSTRLPGKVMLNLDENPVLYYVLEQLRSCKLVDKIIVATTTLDEDDVIENFVATMKVDVFRGSSNDVLDRYYQCAKEFSIDTIVRITADNPLIDPTIVDDLIKKFISNSYDCLTNAYVRTFPYGTEVEIFSFESLEKAWTNAIKPSEREHVTPYLYNNSDNFKIFNVEYPKNISNFRWTIDHENDLTLVKLIVSKIKKRPILINDILDLLSKEPELFEINKNQIPNEGYQKSLKEDEEYLKSRKKDRENHE
ncbi:MAG: glycosyltransferase family protein [Nitrosopumilus sp.]|uniref:glycosyltransferase family protein n=1 Tax=Nitrosopumilus sp. TaxID=2024843 RepID=UPI00242CF915|nr:glycosyltransferase family protein [Nitrosopumilus sp.]MCV0366648.1 glycosyltransferase family protein [Nitrosopumilus sp.]